MGRSADPRKREAILAAALRLFAERGLAGTGTALIAAEAGVATGTLFLYFPTKADLIGALVVDVARRQSELVRIAVGSQRGRDAFEEIWSATVAWFIAHPEQSQFVSAVRDSGLVPGPAAEEAAAMLGHFPVLVADAQAAGSLGAYSPELIGDFFYADLMATVHHVARLSDPAAHQGIVDAGFRIFWAGVSRPPQAP